MDNTAPSQVPDTGNLQPAPAQQFPQGQPQEPSQPSKPKNKKKLFLLLALLVLVLGGAAAAFFLTRGDTATPEETNTAVSQPAAEATPQPTKLWVMNYVDKKAKNAEVSYDGAEVTPIKQSYTPSSSSKFIAHVTEKGVEVAPSNKPDAGVVVLAKASDESVAFKWYDDADKLIVWTQRVANKPSKPDRYYIPDVRQTFYAVNPDGTEKQKLFDKQTTYGAAFITGVSDKRNEFYWGVATEGGPEALLNVSSLDTGELKKNLDPKAFGSEEIVIVGDHTYYVTTDDTIRKINLDTYKDTLVANPLGDTVGTGITALTPTCSVGGSIESLTKVHDNPRELLFSTVTNKPHKSAIYTLDLETNKYTSLVSFDSVREISVLASTKEKMIFSRADAGLCNAKNEKSATSSVYIYDRTSNKNTEVDLDITSQYINAKVYFFAKPAK